MRLLEEISRRYNLNYLQLINMTHHEISDLFERGFNNKLVQEIDLRIKDSVYLLREKRVKILTGEKLKKYINSYINNLGQKDYSFIRGSSASPGIVKGKIQLINNIEDVRHFKRDRILLTVTTLPQYLPAMKIAKAFITDEGGLLSHAAIMSREFKKPCIIGTKIATQVLKDGDLVEVDANKGIVKILKKAK